MEPSRGYSVADASGAEARGGQLLESDDAMLAVGERRNRLVDSGWVDFRPSGVRNSTHPLHRPIVGGRL